MADIEEVLGFWFGELDAAGWPAADRQRLWFGHDPAADRLIDARFGDHVRQAAAGRLREWADAPRGRLALILLLDQFPRNIHRGTSQAFAHDPQALALALAGIEAGHDRALRPIERVFCYLPLEHAEALALQHRAVVAFWDLIAAAPQDQDRLRPFLDYALRHAAIIERFGRFPHRNAILGRVSTPAESRFLQTPGTGFGQVPEKRR